MGNTIENKPQNRISLKKPFLIVLVRPLFNSNVTKVSLDHEVQHKKIQKKKKIYVKLLLVMELKIWS